MSDPERWADGHADPLVRSLFTAAAEEEPPPGLTARVLAPLGAGVATIAAANASALSPTAGGATSAGTSGGLAASSLSPGLAGATFGAVLKWAGIVAVGAAVSAGTISVVTSGSGVSGAPTVARMKAGAPLVAPSLQVGEIATAPAAGPPASEGVPTPFDTVTERQPFTASSPRPAPSSRDESPLRLGEEAALIDETRRAIANGDPSTALRKLGAYHRRYPRPLLAPEALYLEMRAQELASNPAAARRLAERLLAAYPNGVHAARARAVLKGREP